MKITSHNASAYQVATSNAEKNTREKTTVDKKVFEDSLALGTARNTVNIKETNQAIGALQTMKKALDQLDNQLRLSMDNENLVDTQKQVQKILNTTFNGKNVFDEDFSKLSSNIKLNSLSIKKQAQHASSAQDLQKLSVEVKKGKNQVNDAIKILQNRLNNALKTEGSYDQLDTSKLGNLANAHKTSALSLSRVSELLA